MGRKGGLGGGGGGGGKDTTAQMPAVDLYRKRIARQDSRKEKKHLKDVKHLQEAKEGRSLAYKDSLLILVAVGTVFLTAYAILYLAIN